MRIIACAVLGVLSVAVACGSGEGAPAVERVQPEAVAPGDFVLVSGRGLERVATVAIGGRPAAGVTPVNETLLTAVVPAGLSPGEQPLEVRAVDGRRAVARLTVIGGAPATAQPPAAQPTPRPTESPQATRAPQLSASPQRSATPSPRPATGPTATPTATAPPARPATPAPTQPTPRPPARITTPPPPTPTATRRDDDDDDDDDRDEGTDRRNWRGRGR